MDLLKCKHKAGRRGRDSGGTQTTKLLGLHTNDSVKDTSYPSYHTPHNEELLLARSLPTYPRDSLRAGNYAQYFLVTYKRKEVEYI